MQFTTTLKTARGGFPKRQRTRGSLCKAILAATDFSPESLAGVRYASALAEKFRSKIVLVHIVEPFPDIAGMEAVVQARSDEEVFTIARAKLAKLARTQLRDNSRVFPAVGFGKPFNEIINLARQNKADLIVIATHGHTGIGRVVMGSTAENVVRHAHCPVLTVPIRHANRPFRLARILVPIDFSNLSKDALPYAMLMARTFSGEIVLISVVEKFPIDYMLGREITHQTIEPMRQFAEAELQKIADDVRKTTGMKARTVISEGKPFEQICNAAKEHTCDMIVLTTRGYTGLKRMWLGSTAERVVRHAECPVLVVRELEYKFSF